MATSSTNEMNRVVYLRGFGVTLKNPQKLGEVTFEQRLKSKAAVLQKLDRKTSGLKDAHS